MESNFINFELTAAVEYKGYIYFSGVGGYINGLYKMNIITGETEYLASFEREKEFHILHRSAYRYKNEAWFIPWMGEHIVCVNLETLSMYYYPIPYTNINDKNKKFQAAYFSSGRFDEYKLYLIPMKYDTPVIIDMKERTITPYYNTVDLKREEMICGTVIDNELWMCPYIGERMIRLDLDNGEIKYWDWNYQTEAYLGMLYHDGLIWFAPHKADKILYLELETMEYRAIPLGDLYDKQNFYWGVEYYDDKIWMLPQRSSIFLYWDCKDFQLHSFLKERREGMVRIDSDSRLFLGAGPGCYLSVYDEKCQNFHNVKLYMSERMWIDTLIKKYGNCENTRKHLGGELRENYFGLNNFLKFYVLGDH